METLPSQHHHNYQHHHHHSHPFLSAFPKCEHHIHLEGTLTPSHLLALASKNHIPLPATLTSPTPQSHHAHAFANLQEFLSHYYLGISVLIEELDFEALAWAYFQRAHADGVLHAEVSFDPQAHTDRGIALSTAAAGISRACRRAQDELRMTTRVIMCFLRDQPASRGAATLLDARPLIDSGLVHAVGLDSRELGFPPAPFAEVFADAARAGLRRTAHAGEEADHTYIEEALGQLDAERIDHGIRLAGDEDLMARVAASGTLLTVCPLSNVRLGCVDSVAELPIRTFLERGVRFSINSDDPAYFGGYVLDNYVAVQEAFGLSVEEWGVIGRASIEGSWVGEERKEELLGKLEGLLREFEGVPANEL